jgi:hypothetical protein
MPSSARRTQLAHRGSTDLKRLQSWTIAKTSRGPSFLRIEKQRAETLVVLCLSNVRYEVQQQGSTALESVAPVAAPISDREYEELAGLRQGQGWGAPMFQPWHPKYPQTMARVSELEAKERVTAFSQ